MSNKITVDCKRCGKTYSRFKSQFKYGRGLFCSKHCANEFRNRKEKRTCKMCDTEYRKSRAEISRSNVSDFCTKECYFNYRKLNAKATTYLKDGAVHKHRIVAEKALGRKLKTKEIVHHIDNDKQNNLIENLAVLPSQSIHAKIHFGNYNFDRYKLENLI